MSKWIKYIVAPLIIVAIGAAIGCGDKNKRDSLAGYNPGYGFGNWGQHPVTSVSWSGQLNLYNGSDPYRQFLKNTGICGAIFAGSICKSIDSAPYVTLQLDPNQVVANAGPGGGALGQLVLQPRGNYMTGSPITLRGQFRYVLNNTVIRAEGIYGQFGTQGYNRETTIDLIGDPNSGQMQMVVYYRGKTPAHAILQGYVNLNSGWGNNWW